MLNSIQLLSDKTRKEKDIYRPEFFRLKNERDAARFGELIKNKHVYLYDEIWTQLKELIRSRNPSRKIAVDEYSSLVEAHLSGSSAQEYGVWVYYPWSCRLVHILDEAEFIEIRTSRNKYKITEAEQQLLATKKIGVIGLSVGQSVSVTLAMERTVGELRIADFDELEITNLNRLRSGIHNMGLLKTVLVAREIAEIDPFLKVTCFHEGITDDNIDTFLLGNGKLDILIDECDGVDVKINCRIVAKKYGIPVVMEASDRATIDIERYDLEPDRPILHGYVDHLDISKLKGLTTNEEKLPYILPIVGIDTMSTRLKASAVEVGQTITTWPQLASAVTMGGGMTTDVCRRILLDQLHVSGRYFVDIDDFISDPKPSFPVPDAGRTGKLAESHMENQASKAGLDKPGSYMPDKAAIQTMVKAALLAPSVGNLQPWKWYFDGYTLFLFHDEERVFVDGDFQSTLAYISLGAAIEHIHVAATQYQLSVETRLLPLGVTGKNPMIAAFRFLPAKDMLGSPLINSIAHRYTNRNKGDGRKISADILNVLKDCVDGSKGVKLRLLTDDLAIQQVSVVAGVADKLRLFTREGHTDLFNKELRITSEDPKTIKEGIDLRSLDLSPKDEVGFRVIRDPKAIALVNEWGGGGAIEAGTRNLVASSSAVGVITIPAFDAQHILEGGMVAERIWLTATQHGICLHPLMAAVLHFARIKFGGGAGMQDKIRSAFEELNVAFDQLFDLAGSGEVPVYFFRLCYAEPSKLRSHRLDIEDIYCEK